jgi:hypothetical protein
MVFKNPDSSGVKAVIVMWNASLIFESLKTKKQGEQLAKLFRPFTKQGRALLSGFVILRTHPNKILAIQM